jgi:hypothetical protein
VPASDDVIGLTFAHNLFGDRNLRMMVSVVWPRETFSEDCV